MSKILMKLLYICLLALFFYNNVARSSENGTESDYEYENETSINDSENGYNDTDDYDSNELIEDNDCEEKPSFLEKVKLIHKEAKNVTITKHVKHINQTFDLARSARNALRSLFTTDGRAGLEFLEFLSEIDIHWSSQCSTALFRILSSLRKLDFWALKFLDSNGRFIPPGFAEGISSSFGDYDECLNIESPKSENNNPIIKGQYCLMKVIMPFPSMSSLKEEDPIANQQFGFLSNYNLHKLSTVKSLVETLNLSNGTVYRLGICVPHDCSAYEIEDMLNKIFQPITKFPLEVGPKCYVKNEVKTLDKWELTSIVILTVLTVLVLLSTGLEIYNNRKGFEIPEKVSEPSAQINNLWFSFSIIKNTRLLFAENAKFEALDTIRLLVIIIVHIGHLYSLTTSIGVISLKKVFSEIMFKIYEDNKYVFVRSPLVLDVLFTLSGFLLSYGLLRKLEKSKGRFNYLVFLFQRYIKFSVLMFGSIFFYYLFPFSGDGPIWDTGINWILPPCKDPYVLLKSLLFITNFSENMSELANQRCNPPTWFLSALLQLTIIAPIFVITYFKKPILGLCAIISVIIMGCFASIAPHILFGIKSYLQIWELESVIFSNSKSFTWYHLTSNNYLTSFFVGISFGYLMRKEISFSRMQERLFWIISTVMVLTVYFWHNSFWRLDRSAPLWSVLLWHSVGKLFFSLGFAWIIYACCTGRGGYLNQLLSWRGFQPMARLSFGIYLFHYLVVIHRIFTVRDVYVMTDKLMLEHFVVDLIYDTILAYIFYILIEGPFTNLFSLVFSPKPVKELKHFNNSNNNNDNNHVSKL